MQIERLEQESINQRHVTLSLLYTHIKSKKYKATSQHSFPKTSYYATGTQKLSNPNPQRDGMTTARHEAAHQQFVPSQRKLDGVRLPASKGTVSYGEKGKYFCTLYLEAGNDFRCRWVEVVHSKGMRECWQRLRCFVICKPTAENYDEPWFVLRPLPEYLNSSMRRFRSVFGFLLSFRNSFVFLPLRRDSG